MMDNCVFCRIVKGEIASRKVYEDEEILAFHDIHPIAPVHFMLIPKIHIESLAHAQELHSRLLGKIMVLAPKLAKELGLDGGFKTFINTGPDGGQEIMHLHIHVIGGKKPPPIH